MGRTYSWIWRWRITTVGPNSNLSGPALFSSWMLRQMLQIGSLWAEKNPTDTFSEAWNILQLADFIWNTIRVSDFRVCVCVCVCVCVHTCACNVLSHEKPNIWQHWPKFPQGKNRQDLDSSFHSWTGWPRHKTVFHIMLYPSFSAHSIPCLAPICVCSVAQPCPILCSLKDHSPTGSSAHRIFQARILEWRRTRWWRSRWTRSTSLSMDTSGIHLQTRTCMQNTSWERTGGPDQWKRMGLAHQVQALNDRAELHPACSFKWLMLLSTE